MAKRVLIATTGSLGDLHPYLAIVTHPLAYAAQIAAEKTGSPWISTVPTPTVFFSRFDPPLLAPYPVSEG